MPLPHLCPFAFQILHATKVCWAGEERQLVGQPFTLKLAQVESMNWKAPPYGGFRMCQWFRDSWYRIQAACFSHQAG